MKLIQERTAVKLLIEKNGILVSFTTRKRAFFFFLSGPFVGIKIAPTTDPDLGIVELSNYDISSIVDNWNSLYRVRRPRGKKQKTQTARIPSSA